MMGLNPKLPRKNVSVSKNYLVMWVEMWSHIYCALIAMPKFQGVKIAQKSGVKLCLHAIHP